MKSPDNVGNGVRPTNGFDALRSVLSAVIWALAVLYVIYRYDIPKRIFSGSPPVQASSPSNDSTEQPVTSPSRVAASEEVHGGPGADHAADFPEGRWVNHDVWVPVSLEYTVDNGVMKCIYRRENKQQALNPNIKNGDLVVYFLKCKSYCNLNGFGITFQNPFVDLVETFVFHPHDNGATLTMVTEKVYSKSGYPSQTTVEDQTLFREWSK